MISRFGNKSEGIQTQSVGLTAFISSLQEAISGLPGFHGAWKALRLHPAWSAESSAFLRNTPLEVRGMLKGEIVNVSVDKSALTDGKEDISKVAPICIDPFNHSYHVIGEKVGMAWGFGKSLM